MTMYYRYENGTPVALTPAEAVAWDAKEAAYVPPAVSSAVQPALFAAVAVCIENGAIATIELAAQLQGAIYEDGWLMVFFAQPQDAADYLVFAQSDVPAKIEQFKDANAFELVFSDADSNPVNPGRVDITIVKVR